MELRNCGIARLRNCRISSTEQRRLLLRTQAHGNPAISQSRNFAIPYVSAIAQFRNSLIYFERAAIGFRTADCQLCSRGKFLSSHNSFS